MKKHATKHALLTSILSLLLCVSMLVSTTFAWFTDEVTSANNIIKSGNLDIEMEWKDATAAGKQQTYVDAAKGAIFNYDLWEPGYVEAKNISIKNVGTLDLKYVLNIVPTGEVSALADVIDVYFAEGEITLASREMTELANIGTLAEVLAKMPANMNGALEANTAENVTIALKMQETAGNAYQNLSIGSDFAVKLFATQLVSEQDSFGPDYDKETAWTASADTAWYDASKATFTLTSPEELAGLAQLVNSSTETFKNKTVKLGADIDLNNQRWIPIGNASSGFNGTFDGNGHTVYNLYVKEVNHAGLFGYALDGGNVKNLNVENAYIEAGDYAGAIMGRGYTDIDNCHVKNVTVITAPYWTGSKYDGGAKAGGVIGQLLEGAGNTVTKCSATDVKVYGFRDIGGVVGMVHNNNACSDNTASNITVGYILFDQITADKNENAGAIYGRVAASATVSPAKDSAENNAFTQVYAVYDALTLTSLANFVNGVSTAYNPDSFKNQTVVMLDDIDLKGAAWTPIGKTFNQYEFKGVFDGMNHTVSNFTVDNKAGAALFGFVRGLNGSAGVKNLTVKNVVAAGGDYVAGVVGQLYGTIENCHAIDVTVTATPFLLADGTTYDGGAKAGGVVGWMESGSIYTATNCTARNVNIKAYRDLGGVIGMAHNNNVINDCKCYDSELSYVFLPDGAQYSGGTVNGNIGAVIGRRGSNVVESGIYSENVTIPNVFVEGNLYDTINGLKSGDTLILPGKTYITTGTFKVPAGVTIKGAEGQTVVIHQDSAAQDDIFNCAGDVVIENITFESNRKGYAIAGNAVGHDGDGDITVIGCKFVGIATEKNWGIYKNLNGSLTVKDCTFDNYNNALCGINNGNGSETTVTGCTFTKINGEAIGYVASTMPADFEATVIANNTGLTAENVIGY